MSVADEFGARARQMRQKAEELEQAAERASDPEERRRLKEKARHLQGAEPDGVRRAWHRPHVTRA